SPPRADLVPDRGPRRGPGLADPRRLDRGRRGGRPPPRPREGVHPRRDGRVRGPARARLDGRGEEGGQAPLGGQDLPRGGRRRRGDPLQPLSRSPRRRQFGRPPSASGSNSATIERKSASRSSSSSASPVSRSARKFSLSSVETLTAAVSRSSETNTKPC